MSRHLSRCILHALLLGVFGAGCSLFPPSGAPRAFTWPVPPGVTFDLARGQALSPDQVAARLARTRLLFLGEIHTEPRSHAFQREVIAQLAQSGRPLAVALEMFPPEADAALEDWRLGRLDELTFLERSDWYRHWGHPWAPYRELFHLFREQRVALYGVNADKNLRDSVRAGKSDDLSPEERALLGDADEVAPPHADYLLDALRRAGHGAELQADSDAFRRYYRVQRMWDRVMGLRAVRLAERLGAEGVAVLLVGSGHLAHGLGANLQAARDSALPRLTVWDALVEPGDLDNRGCYPVPLGMADWARVYLREAAPVQYRSLSPLRLEADPAGVKVAAVSHFADTTLQVLQPGDVIVALEGAAPGSPTALRLAYESLTPGQAAHFTVLRASERIEVEAAPPSSGH